jgi:predicted porin
MNRKILTMAVAAAMIAPGAAMAEAILYGKLNVSLDYANVTNVVLPQYGFENVDPATGQAAVDEYGRPVVITNPSDPRVVLDSNGNPTLIKVVGGEDFEGWGMSNGYIPGERRANRIGVKGSEDLGNGLKAIYQVEFGINLNDTNNNVLGNADTISYRNTFVGLAGDAWGTALVGRHDTPMKISTGKLDLFADTMADYNGTVGFRDLRADNVVAYISPSWSGFQLAGAIVPSGGATGGGQGLNLDEDSLAGAYSLAAIYSNGPFYGSVAYESLGSDHFNTQNTSLYWSNCPYESPMANNRGPNTPYNSSCAYTDDDATAWRIGLGLLDWNGFTLTGVWETRDNEPFSNTYTAYTDPTDAAWNFVKPGNSDSVDLWQIQAAYAFGNSMVKAMYGQADYDSDDFSAGEKWVASQGGAEFINNLKDNYNRDVETWAIGFDHNLSKRTKAYALYTAVDNDAKNVRAGSEWDGFSIGMMHSF